MVQENNQQPDLEIVCVYTKDKIATGYAVKRVDGSIINVDKDTILQYGKAHHFSNALICDSGMVRVSREVPRRDISQLQ